MSTPGTAAWITAIRHSHDRFAALIGFLPADQVTRPSYADDWTIAQVASHLGSQAEIFDLFLTAGLSGTDAPDPEVFRPIWDHWNTLPPHDQCTKSVASDEKLVARLEGLSAAERQIFALSLFGLDLDLAGYTALRLGEHALHTWDIAVALDPAATLSPDAVDLLVDTLPRTAGRAGKPVPAGKPIVVNTTAPDHSFLVELDPAVSVTPRTTEPAPEAPVLRLPAEAFIRLVAGRLDPDHTPPGTTDPDQLDQLREAFPGF
jgi:uncharacterized protein (TIGR03083 family)